MKRDLKRLCSESFDVLIIGGGINGVCAAIDAAQRGLRTALVDKGDFGGATSSGSYKILHGGLRYLQHLNFRRMRSSINERRFMMQAAPHLVRPLSFLVPCKGYGMKSPEAMALALKINDGMSYDRNRGLPEEIALPRGRVLSNQEAEQLAPFLPQDGHRGSGLFYDGQMIHSERMNIAFAAAADRFGACVANYIEVLDFEFEDRKISKAIIRDHVNNREHTISCRSVLNLAGPWNHRIQGKASQSTPAPTTFSKGIQLFTEGEISSTGFTFESQQTDSTAVLQRGTRLNFGTPFQGTTFWGTTDSVYEGDPDDFEISRDDALAFLDEINHSLPTLNIAPEQIVGVCGGLRPMNIQTGAASNTPGIEVDTSIGMVVGRGIKYTTSRDFTETLIDHIYKVLDKPIARASSHQITVPGAPENGLQDLRSNLSDATFTSQTIERLIHHYGANASKVAQHSDDLSDGQEALLSGEVRYAIEEEMAVHLDDVLVRRSSAGNPRVPSEALIKNAARCMGEHMGWDDERLQSEIARVKGAFPAWLQE